MTAYDAAALALPNVLAYWPMDDAPAAGTLLDASGGAIGPLPFGAGLGTSGLPSILPGDASTCVHKSVANSMAITWASLSGAGHTAVQQRGPFTYMGWIQPDGVTGDINYHQYLGGQWLAWMFNLTKTNIAAYVDATPLAQPVTLGGIAPGNPVFVALVYDRTNVLIYLNGVLVSITPATGDVVVNANNFEVGGILGNSGGGAGIVGFMQKFQWLGSALSAAQIQSLYVIGGPPAAAVPGENFYVCPFSRQIADLTAGQTAEIQNDSDTPYYLNLGAGPAVPHQGPRIEPNGGTWSSEGLWVGPIQIVHSNWLGAKIALIQVT